MLDVKNGKIAKVNSSLTPEERDNFFGIIAEALNKIGFKKENEADEEECEKSDNIGVKELEEESNVIEKFERQVIDEDKKSTKEEEKEEQDSKKVSAEKLIKEFASFINNIS